ncbi:MAG: hypothetical protein H8D78_20615 [Chloroflexi bacterium]|nr:hypothetical protein [Chloroflexota bacterium]
MSNLIAEAVLLAVQVLVFVILIRPWVLRQLRIVAELMDVIRQIGHILG